jgi:hypothetical protein
VAAAFSELQLEKVEVKGTLPHCITGLEDREAAVGVLTLVQCVPVHVRQVRLPGLTRRPDCLLMEYSYTDNGELLCAPFNC